MNQMFNVDDRVVRDQMDIALGKDGTPIDSGDQYS